jgi:hypothetical protein
MPHEERGREARDLVHFNQREEALKMTGLGRAGQRSILMPAVRGLADQAMSMAQAYAMDSKEWQFYAGVQRAAQDALHAEVQAVHGDAPSWLRHEAAAFQDGYLKTSALLASAMTAPEPPLRLPLPAMA